MEKNGRKYAKYEGRIRKKMYQNAVKGKNFYYPLGPAPAIDENMPLDRKLANPLKIGISLTYWTHRKWLKVV